MLAVMAGGLCAGPAAAVQSPANCQSNNLVLNVKRDKTIVRIGDTVTFTVTASNLGGDACDITGARVTLQAPALDGTPTGPVTVLTPSKDFPAGTADAVVGSTVITIAANSGVTDAVVQAAATGVLHDAPADHGATITKTLGTTITRPHMVLTKTGSTRGGVAPQTVTYTYTLNNDGDAPIGNVVVTDNLCSPLTQIGVDTVLDPGETWTYTCTQTFNAAGTYVNTATATGRSTVDNQPVTAGPVTWTVVVTVPAVVASPPNVPVVAPAKSNSAACVSTPKTLSVRAKELTTVKVTVTADDGNGSAAGSVVKITGPGFTRTAKTNSKGVVEFKVRPTRTGTITVTSDRCLKAEKVTVKAARRTQARRVPQVTG